jgi:hypothetical protein
LELIYQPAKKVVFVFLAFTLVSSLSAVVFVTDNNLAFAKKHDSSGGGEGGGGGGSSNGGSGDGGSDSSSSSSNDKGSGSNGEPQGGDSVDSSGSGTTSDANNNNNSPPPSIDSTNNSPLPVTPDNIGAGNQIQGLTAQQQEQQQEQQQQPCPAGQHFDVNQNACVNDTASPLKFGDCSRQPGTHWDSSQGQCVPDSSTRGNLPPSEFESNPIFQDQQPPNKFGDCSRQPGTHWDESQGQCVPDTTGMDPNVAKATNTPNAAGSVPSSPLQQSGGPISTTAPPISSSLPECVPGYHWDISQQQCVAGPSSKLPANALETSNNNPNELGEETQFRLQNNLQRVQQSSQIDSNVQKKLDNAVEAAAAAEGAKPVPSDGKCPPGYQLHDNLCFPQPIDKNSPEAAMRQGIGGSTNTRVSTEGVNPPNQFGAGNIGSLPPSAFETNPANCPEGTHSDGGKCFDNRQPLSTGDCAPGWHLVSDTGTTTQNTHCEQNIPTRGSLPPSTLETSNNPAFSTCFGETHSNSDTGNCDDNTEPLPTGGCVSGYIQGENGRCHLECGPYRHWDSSAGRCLDNTSHGSGGTDGTGF